MRFFVKNSKVKNKHNENCNPKAYNEFRMLVPDVVHGEVVKNKSIFSIEIYLCFAIESRLFFLIKKRKNSKNYCISS